MHTSRLATLLFTILSVSTASHASTSQSQDGFYQLFANGGRTLMYIQKSTPLSTIRTYFSKKSYPTDIRFTKFTKDDNGLVKIDHSRFNLPNKDLSPQAISFQDFLEKYLSINEEKTTQNLELKKRPTTNYFFDVHTTPTKASSKASTIIFEYQQPDEFFKSLQGIKSSYEQCIVFANNTALEIASDKDIETLRNIVPLPQTKPAQPTINTPLNTPNNNNKKPTKTSLTTPKPKKKILDNNNISPLPNNDTPLSKTNDTSLNNNNDTLLSPSSDTNQNNNNNQNIVNNNNNNTSQNNHLNNNTLLSPSSDTNQNNNNNQSTLNNNNNNASNQAGTYILVVFGLTVCAGIVYAMIPSAPTSNSHKPNQDTRTR